MTEQVFSYCKLKNNGNCACARGGEAMCPRMIREAQDAELREEIKREYLENEKAKRAKYVQDEPLRSGWFTKNPFLDREGRYFGPRPETMRVPLRREVDFAWTDEAPKRTAIDQIEISRHAFSRLGGDFAEIERRVQQFLREKIIIDEAHHFKAEWITLKDRRTGSIPKEKRKPHHRFLEDPTRRKYK